MSRSFIDPPPYPSVTRRIFLKSSGLALVSFGVAPRVLTRAVYAAEGAARRGKTLVAVFQRGACDGLNTVVPYGEKSYYALRPSIAVPAPRGGSKDAALDLDGFFGLHPALEPLLPLWKEKSLAIVHAVGSPDPTRSHFDAQDFMESGTPGRTATEDGWLNRALENAPEENASPFRAVAMGANLPRMLRGATAAIVLPDVRQFKVMAQNSSMNHVAEGGFEAMYAQTVDHALRGTGTETF